MRPSLIVKMRETFWFHGEESGTTQNVPPGTSGNAVGGLADALPSKQGWPVSTAQNLHSGIDLIGGIALARTIPIGAGPRSKKLGLG